MSVALDTAVVDGRVVRYLDAGNRQAANVIVLVHAFPMGVHMWAPQSSAFEGWRVLAPALPGFDGSDLLPDASIEAYGRQLLAFLEQLGVHRAVIAGLSMGGYVAFSMLRQAPHRVAALVLADTRAGSDSPESVGARERLLGITAREGAAGVAQETIPKLLGTATQKDRPEVAASVRRMIEGQPEAAISGAIRAMMTRPDSTALLATVRVPTLIVVGEEDVLTPPVESERMHHAIPGSTLARIPAAGHLTNLENPVAFNQVVAEWLIEVRPTA